MSDYFGDHAGDNAVSGPVGGGQTATPVQSASAPAAWYPDPYQPGALRWFDGYRWTEHVAAPPSQGAPAAGGWSTQPGRNRGMEALLPVNRTGLSIAAGYAGLFSILLVFAPIALLLGILALVELTKKPDVGGRGRAWFGVIAGAFGTVGLFAVMVH